MAYKLRNANHSPLNQLYVAIYMQWRTFLRELLLQTLHLTCLRVIGDPSTDPNRLAQTNIFMKPITSQRKSIEGGDLAEMNSSFGKYSSNWLIFMKFVL